MSDVDLALRLKPEGAIHQLGFGDRREIYKENNVGVNWL